MNNKKEIAISIRISKKDKEKIERYAYEQGKSLSKYMVDSALKKGKKVLKEKSELEDIYVATMFQEIANYIKRTYKEDNYLEEAIEKIWIHM